MKLLSVEEARSRILAGIEPKAPAETVDLAAAVGRVLAEPVTAVRPQPPFDASAMDGWAIAGTATLFRIVGESAAGRGHPLPLEPGEAVRIFTGAPVPAGATRVVIQEVARREGDFVETPPAEDERRDNIRPLGGDFAAGEVLLGANVRLDPWRIGLAASAGRAELAVRPKPVVALLATGEELVQPGGAPGPDQIFELNGPALAALIEGWGGAAYRLATTGDDIDAIVAALADAEADLIVTLGGASVGDHDLVKPALARLGLELSVESVRVRPGKPTWFGRLADGRRVLGLPGNPASALVCAELFLRPALNAMLGLEPGPRLATARLVSPAPANGSREHWERARASLRDGVLCVAPAADQDSSLVAVFAGADVLVKRPVDAPPAATGDVVEILMLDRL